MNKRTIALTTEQYKEIIQTMREGFCGCRPNERIATALVLEGNLGLRISDILSLRLSDIVRDGDRYRLEITEQKTKKKRVFTVPLGIYRNIVLIWCFYDSCCISSFCRCIKCYISVLIGGSCCYCLTFAVTEFYSDILLCRSLLTPYCLKSFAVKVYGPCSAVGLVILLLPFVAGAL